MQTIKQIDRQRIVRFLVGGGSATLVHYAVMGLLIALGVDAVVATSVGMLVGAVYNYLFQYYRVFRSQRDHLPTLMRYGVSVGLYFVSNVALFAFFYHGMGIGIAISQILATAVTTVQNYFLYQKFVYAGKKSPPST